MVTNSAVMSIENVKVKYIRPKGYHNLREWMEDEQNVYIGRKGVVFIDKQRYPKTHSPFYNPFKVNKDGTRKEVIAKYKIYITEKLKNDEHLVQELMKLKDKNLGCWCFPEPCHGNVLLELLQTNINKSKCQ